MEVQKFGGASVKNASSIRNVGKIIETLKGQNIIVVSATGKTTNALEEVLRSYVAKDQKCFDLLKKVKNDHVQILSDLEMVSNEQVDELNDAFVEIDWMIEDEPQDEYNYLYDQIVSVGELVSSKIVYAYLKSLNLSIAWLDVRDVLITDNTYREATVNWELTSKKIKDKCSQLFEKYDLIITQGFIGSSSENFTTTLGREGSDYTAAIFSYCLEVDCMNIWKDVPGILTADPKLFEHVQKIDRLSYLEAIEMTYYGAKVIHPKTIKPIQNKNIPLKVRSFVDPEGSGTLISDIGEAAYPPVVVIEQDQSLIHISTKDFSFVAEHHLRAIFEYINARRLKVNMMRNTAISFTISVNSEMDKIETFMKDLENDFNLRLDTNLELITIRHYDTRTLESMKSGKVILFEEAISETYRMAVKDIPPLVRKN